MNITRTDIAELNAILTLKVTKEDYKNGLDKRLKEARKTFVIDGFRPGLVPMEIIQKRFGKSILVEEVLKNVQDSLYEYIKDNNIKTLGEPLEVMEVNQKVLFDGEEFEFAFEIGLAPEFDIDLADNTFTYYDIVVDEKAIDTQIEDICNRNARPANVEIVDGDKCMVKGDLQEIDEDGNLVEGAQDYLDIIVSLKDMATEEARNLLLGATVGQDIKLNPKTDLAPQSISHILKVDKNALDTVDKTFKLNINEITSFIPAELGEELYNNVFPDDEIKDEATFRARVASWLKGFMYEEADAKLFFDARKQLIEETNLSLPIEFLKKWLLKVNDSKTATPKKLEEELPIILTDLKWQLIKGKLMKQSNIDISEDEIMNYAIASTRSYMNQIGYYYTTDEKLRNYAATIVKKEDERNKIIDQISSSKIIMVIKDKSALDMKTISREEYNLLIEADQKGI